MLCLLALWFLGYPDQSLQRSMEALAQTRERSSPYNRAFALHFASWLHQLRREGHPAQEHAEAAIALANEHGFPFWTAWGTIDLGWAQSAQGQHQKGIETLLQGIDAHRQTGSTTNRPYGSALLAEAFVKVGRAEEALDALSEPLATLGETSDRSYEAELYRLKGELMLMRSASNANEAERLFHAAIETARHQKAKSLELRATMSLSRLLRDTDRRDEARAMLADIYNWFTEGFDTADLKDAKALLEELNG